jgi:pSer/pThr/pTyr-binding forkhead associated (FHA) protein
MLLDLYPVTRLGKDTDNDVVLHDAYVSRHHARLYWDGAGWWVEDLSSKNGTTLNGNACPERVPQAVSAGNKLGIGGMVFELAA